MGFDALPQKQKAPKSLDLSAFAIVWVLGCAQNRTRTCTSLLTLVPETSASTNFAIWAAYRGA